jgi:hypothetical protein
MLSESKKNMENSSAIYSTQSMLGKRERKVALTKRDPQRLFDMVKAILPKLQAQAGLRY